MPVIAAQAILQNAVNDLVSAAVAGSRKLATTAKKLLDEGLPVMTLQGYENAWKLLNTNFSGVDLFRILVNVHLYVPSIPGLGAITRERVLEQLLKVQNVRGVKQVLVPRLGIDNATAAKGFVNELFFAADRGAIRVSKQMKVDQLRDVDAILPGGEYCQLKAVSADLDYSKSLGAWLEAATREVGANKVRLVLPSGVSITQNLRDWIRQSLGFTNDDIDNVLLSIKYPP